MKSKLNVLSFELKKIKKNKIKLINGLLLPFMVVLFFGIISLMFSNEKNYCVYISDGNFESYSLKTGDGKEVEIIAVTQDELETMIKDNENDVNDIYIDYANNKIYYYSTGSSYESLKYFSEELLVSQKMYEEFPELSNLEGADVCNLSENQSIWTRTFSIMLIYLFLPVLFGGVSNTIVSSIAEEKEVQIFARTLLAPVSIKDINFGKTAAAVIYGIMISVAYFVETVLGLCFMRKFDSDGMFIKMFSNITWTQILVLFLYAVLYALFVSIVSALICYVVSGAGKAKSILYVCQLCTLILGFMAVFRTGKAAAGSYLIPVYNICLVFQDVIYETYDFTKAFICMASLTVCSVIMLFMCFRAMKNEEAVF